METNKSMVESTSVQIGRCGEFYNVMYTRRIGAGPGYGRRIKSHSDVYEDEYLNAQIEHWMVGEELEDQVNATNPITMPDTSSL